MRTSLTARALCLLAVAVLGLSACGLKGDLYLPEPEPAPAETAEDTAESDDDAQRS
jgi:predicted small lipoprotein YifL